MGMFDHVDFEMDCPKCGRKMNNFQSKDGECYFNRVKITEVNNFYDSCKHCNAWVEFIRKKAKGLDDFEMKIELPEK